MPERLSSLLKEHFAVPFNGGNGNYSSVFEALKGLTARQAMWKPERGANSIWDLTQHLISSKQWMIDMLQKGEAAETVWEEKGGDDAEWNETVRLLTETHKQLIEALADVSDETLLTRPIPELDHTLFSFILAAGTEHDAYHSGQIMYLRKLQEKMRLTFDKMDRILKSYGLKPHTIKNGKFTEYAFENKVIHTKQKHVATRIKPLKNGSVGGYLYVDHLKVYADHPDKTKMGHLPIGNMSEDEFENTLQKVIKDYR